MTFLHRNQNRATRHQRKRIRDNSQNSPSPSLSFVIVVVSLCVKPTIAYALRKTTNFLLKTFTCGKKKRTTVPNKEDGDLRWRHDHQI